MSGHPRPGPRQGSLKERGTDEFWSSLKSWPFLTPVGLGVAQVFHDLLVELRLLLVAEVEEGEEEEGQEESWEVESGVGQVEETTTWKTMMMTVSGVRTRLELEQM